MKVIAALVLEYFTLYSINFIFLNNSEAFVYAILIVSFSVLNKVNSAEIYKIYDIIFLNKNMFNDMFQDIKFCLY